MSSGRLFMAAHGATSTRSAACSCVPGIMWPYRFGDPELSTIRPLAWRPRDGRHCPADAPRTTVPPVLTVAEDRWHSRQTNFRSDIVSTKTVGAFSWDYRSHVIFRRIYQRYFRIIGGVEIGDIEPAAATASVF